MQHNFFKTYGSTIFFILYSILGILALVYIPYFFPSPKLIAASASYAYGFNNKIGIFILILLCSGFVFFGFIKNKSEAIDHQTNILLKKHDATLYKTFKTCMFFQFLFCLIIWGLLRNTFGIGESAYFISRLNDLVIGRKLYTEIDFAYGPLLLYIPLYLYKILVFVFGTNTSIQDAYSLSVLLLQCFGFYEFYRVFNSINITGSVKKAIFIILFIATLPMMTGINYVIFRFITPFAIINYLSRKDENDIFTYSILIYTAILLVTNISLEIGIALSFTFIVSNIVKYILNRTKYNIFYVIISLFAIITYVVTMPEGLFRHFSLFLSGGFNFPFILMYVHAFFFCIIFFFAFNIGKQLNKIRQNIDILTLELLACTMLPAALGRCEPGHLLYNGIFILMITASFIKKYIYQKFYVAALVIFISVSLTSYMTVVYPMAYANAIIDNQIFGKFIDSKIGQSIIYKVGMFFGIEEQRILRRLDRRDKKIPHELKEISDVAAPFGSIGLDNAIYIYLSNNSKYHHLPFKDIFTSGSIEAVNQNLFTLKREKPQYLLLPKNWKELYNLSFYYAEEIKIRLTTRYSMPQKNNVNELLLGTIQYIDSMYEFLQELDVSLYLYQLK